MADLKISQLDAITTLTPATDVLPVVNVGGVTKKITTNQILGSGGTATLASATITGDLTVDTSTLKVDSTNNRVGIVNASPTVPLDVVGTIRSKNVAGDVGGLRMWSDSAGDGNIYEYFNGSLKFGVNDTLAMTLNSTGLSALRYTSTSSSASLPAYAVSAGNGAYNSGTNQIGFSINSTSAMTLNSTGLGIGVESPTQKLSVNGAIDFKAYVAHMDNFAVYAHTSDGTTLASFSGYPITFRVANTERMRIDTSGNVGVGVSTFGTSAAKVLGLGTGTEPTTGPAGTVQLFTSTRSASNTIPAIFTEGSGVTNAAITNTTVTNKIAIKVNGTIYYLLATTSAV